jgi:hypothetical protein
MVLIARQWDLAVVMGAAWVADCNTINHNNRYLAIDCMMRVEHQGYRDSEMQNTHTVAFPVFIHPYALVTVVAGLFLAVELDACISGLNCCSIAIFA